MNNWKQNETPFAFLCHLVTHACLSHTGFDRRRYA